LGVTGPIPRFKENQIALSGFSEKFSLDLP
jgi:hypothetical protein